jgi:ubiquinone/menaquinone biosynthesis C-methylase UbiE
MDNNEYLEKYYASKDEDNRLLSKHGQIEFITTMNYLNRYLSKDKKIIEIGAGTGRYSLTLANNGFSVDAVELVQHNIDIFKRNIKPESKINVYKGNAVNLDFIENEKYDITLLLGPMYHLYTIEEQKKAISEAYRITKNKGIIFVAYCIADSTIIQYGFIQNNIKKIIEKGILEKETYKAYSTAEEVFQLYRKEDIDYLNSFFKVFRLHYVATDLFTRYMDKTIENMDEEEYNIYLDYHLKMCERYDLVGLTNHSLDILKKYENE